MLSWGIIRFSLQVFTCFLILFQRREPVSSIAWIFCVLLFPIPGIIIFFLLGYFPFERKKRKIKRYRGKRSLLQQMPNQHISLKKPGFIQREEETKVILQQEGLINTSQLLNNLTANPLTNLNEIQLLVDGKETYQAMEERLLEAKHYILFQFFIFEADHVGKRFRDILIQKAREGIKVYFLYDHLANLFFLTRGFIRKMKQEGILVERFSPIYSISRTFQFNFRNHRKLVIIDGQEAFTGGMNIGREYLGENKKLKGWRDNHFFVRGEVVSYMEQTFLEDWFFATNKHLTLPKIEGEYPQSNTYIQAIPSGPNDFIGVKHLTFLQLVQAAQSSVWIQTPYFIPDNSILQAFQLAALKGIDVRLMIPRIPQYLPIHYASHSFLPELLDAGVKVYRYLPCFLHTKTCIIDDSACLIGSTNLDNRSFKLNFELDLLILDRNFNREMKALFHGDQVRCENVNAQDLKELQFPRVILSNFWRLFAPTL